MTVEKLNKANELYDNIKEINYIITDDGTNFNTYVSTSNIGHTAINIFKEEFLELLRNKRAELQQQFNDL